MCILIDILLIFIAFYSESFNMIVFASQYRGVDGGTEREEFGGSRGRMMTYMALREDDRIKKDIVVSGVFDAFMNYEYSDEAMRKEVYEDLIGGSLEEMQEEYKTLCYLLSR